jgi:hypothetical protein
MSTAKEKQQQALVSTTISTAAVMLGKLIITDTEEAKYQIAHAIECIGIGMQNGVMEQRRKRDRLAKKGRAR